MAKSNFGKNLGIGLIVLATVLTVVGMLVGFECKHDYTAFWQWAFNNPLKHNLGFCGV